jgi:hypothetical protein
MLVSAGRQGGIPTPSSGWLDFDAVRCVAGGWRIDKFEPVTQYAVRTHTSKSPSPAKVKEAPKTLNVHAAKDATAVRRIAEKTCPLFWSEGVRA